MSWDNAMWAQGRETCGECGDRYHRSGTEECACRECETEDCDVVVNTNKTTICVDCEDAAQGSEKPTSTFATPKDALAAVVALSMQALSDDTTEGGES